MDKTGRNGIRVGDIELKILQIVTEHCWQARNDDQVYDVSIQYNLAELEKNSLKLLKN
jgi:hypothetical protein